MMTEHRPHPFFANYEGSDPASRARPGPPRLQLAPCHPTWQVEHTPTKSLPEADIPLPGAGRSP